MLRQHVAAWWTGLGQRERIMVLSACAVLMIAILYLVAIEPAWETRARLVRELPQLQEQYIQLEALRVEAQQLTGRGGAVADSDALRTAAEQSVLRANLVAGVATGKGGAITVSASNVPAHRWFSWLETFSRETRAVVQAATVERADGTGQVNAEVSFQANDG